MTHTLTNLKELIWGPPLLILIFVVGIYLTILLRGMQFRYLGYALVQTFRKTGDDEKGDITPFQSLMTALAGAIGTGSIAGVATGITVGGMGSLFWMWITALVVMAVKYAESLLAVKYRDVDKNGEMVGGPMEYIEHGLGWKWMAKLFAVFGILAAIGTGNLVQVNSIGDALHYTWGINPWVSGIVLSVMTGIVLLGGVQSIGRVAGVLVPIMAFFYVVGGLIILCIHMDKIPGVFSEIFYSAFHGQAAVGGFTGATVMIALQSGVMRSIFSNEAGLGISSIASAAAKTDHPGRQAMIAMTGALISTIIVCTITGLVIGVTGTFGVVDSHGRLLSGASLAVEAFSHGFPGGQYIVTVGLLLFAYSTVLAWAYYGEKCCEYLFHERSEFYFRIIFALIVIPGAAIDMQVAWTAADLANGLMAIPNLIVLLALGRVIHSETQDFLARVKKEREDKKRGA
jgi:AGCS family alanine or glycine:cation symporter